MDIDQIRVKALDAASDFAKVCLEFHDKYGENALELIMNDLVSELIDCGFVEDEIRESLNSSLCGLKKYAQG